MIPTRLRTLAFLGLVVTLWLLRPVPASAHGCGVACDPDMPCTGACILNAPGPSGSGATCGGFQSPRLPTCKMSAGDLIQGGGTVACGNPEGKIGWAVVRTHWPSPEEPNGVHVLRASSSEFADYTQQVFVPHLDGVPNARLDAEILLAAPAGPCEEVQFSIPSLQPDLKGVGHWKPVVAYFRATTSQEHLATFELLYSEAPLQDVERAYAAAKDWIWIYSKRDEKVPLEIYGSLIVNDGYLGFLIEAASPLAAAAPAP